MADLTTGRLALLRDRLAWDTEPHCLSTADFAALLDMAERCAKAEAERDCFESQCDYYKADLDAIRAMMPNVEGVCTQDIVRDRLKALEKAEAELARLSEYDADSERVAVERSQDE